MAKLSNFLIEKGTFRLGDQVVSRDEILDQWRFGTVTKIDGHHCRVHFRGDEMHKAQKRPKHWVSADLLFPQSAVCNVVEQRPGGSSVQTSGKRKKRVQFEPDHELKKIRWLRASARKENQYTEEQRKSNKARKRKRREEQLKTIKLMREQGVPKTFFSSDYTKHIPEDQDDDDDGGVVLPSSVSNCLKNFRDNDRDDDDNTGARLPFSGAPSRFFAIR